MPKLTKPKVTQGPPKSTPLMPEPLVEPGEIVGLQPPRAGFDIHQNTILVKTNGVKIFRQVIPAGGKIPTHAVQGKEIVHCLEAANAPPTRHRIGTVRRRQGVSLRTISRNWNVDVEEVRRQQQETSDLTLSQLYRWQQILGVPVVDLLVEEGQELSDPVLRRVQLIKVMKTVVTMKETAHQVRIQRLITMLLAQLVEIMPELAHVGPWHGSGTHRTLDDLGRAADCRLSEDMI